MLRPLSWPCPLPGRSPDPPSFFKGFRKAQVYTEILIKKMVLFSLTPNVHALIHDSLTGTGNLSFPSSAFSGCSDPCPAASCSVSGDAGDKAGPFRIHFCCPREAYCLCDVGSGGRSPGGRVMRCRSASPEILFPEASGPVAGPGRDTGPRLKSFQGTGFCHTAGIPHRLRAWRNW